MRASHGRGESWAGPCTRAPVRCSNKLALNAPNRRSPRHSHALKTSITAGQHGVKSRVRVGENDPLNLSLVRLDIRATSPPAGRVPSTSPQVLSVVSFRLGCTSDLTKQAKPVVLLPVFHPRCSETRELPQVSRLDLHPSPCLLAWPCRRRLAGCTAGRTVDVPWMHRVAFQPFAFLFCCSSAHRCIASVGVRILSLADPRYDELTSAAARCNFNPFLLGNY